MSVQQPGLSSQQLNDITAYINVYRERHQAPPLTYDTTISAVSQQWSYYLVVNKQFKHSGTTLYGENLAYYQGYGIDPVVLIKKAIDDWYNEVSLYNFTAGVFSEAAGHFTCLVWKSSTIFGIGITINTATQEADVVMNTAPPGNVMGQFIENVLPAVPGPGPTPPPGPGPGPGPTPPPGPGPGPGPTPPPGPGPTPPPGPGPTPPPGPGPTPPPGPGPTPGPIRQTKASILNQIIQLIFAIQAKKPQIVLSMIVRGIITSVSYALPPGPIKNIIIHELYIVNRTLHQKYISQLYIYSVVKHLNSVPDF
jgi:hypothetical protein